MPNSTLQIVSFDNPYPPIYGGVVEVYNKLKPLHNLGIKIHLHCFVTEIPSDYSELQEVTENVYFYKTTRNPKEFFSMMPFSVASRTDGKLLDNLRKSDAPILFESLKTTYLVQKDLLPNHRKFLRLHNIEHYYFSGISQSEKNTFKKYLYKSEALKFVNYETVISKFEKVFALSIFEQNYTNQKFGNSVYIPVFHGNKKVAKLTENGKFAFYHGDLRMSDNLKSVKTLIDIFKRIPDVKFVIASSNGQKLVERMIGGITSIEFVPLQSHDQLLKLLADAHMNVMMSYQQSGTKLKLMASLYNSRHCIINDNISDDPKVTQLCHIANTEDEIREKIQQLKNEPYLDFEKRRALLESYLNDDNNAKLLAAEIWNNK